MKILMVVLAGAIAAGACDKKPAEDMMPAPGSSGAMGSGGGMGSSMASGRPNPHAGSAEWDAGTGSGSAVAPKPKPTPEQLVERYAQCWTFLDDEKWGDYQSCYAPDAVFAMPGLGTPQMRTIGKQIEDTKKSREVFPDETGALQLVIASGNDIVGVVRVTGSHVKEKKRVGYLLAHAVSFDDAGRMISDSQYFDAVAVLAQMSGSKLPFRGPPAKDWPERPRLVAKGSDAERANLATYDQLVTAFNQRDAKAVGALLADDVVWSEQPLDKDLDKKAVLAHLPALWKGFSKLELGTVKSWAAGDYVAATQTLSGTHDGTLAVTALGKIDKTGRPIALPQLSVFRIEGGKVKAAWVFWQKAGLAAQLGIQ